MSLTRIFQRPELQRGKFMTDLFQICQLDKVTRRVIILESVNSASKCSSIFNSRI